jgi:hypothetical protein
LRTRHGAGPSLEGSAETNETLSENLNVISYAVLGPASQLMPTVDVHVTLSAVNAEQIGF